MEVLLSGLGGGILRLAPEVLRFWDGKLDRDHEYRLALQHTEHLKVLGTERVDLLTPDYGIAGAHEAYIQKATERASKKYPLIDLLAASVRPTVTWALVLLYGAVTVAGLLTGKRDYGAEDLSLLSAVLSFWFVGRVWERVK